MIIHPGDYLKDQSALNPDIKPERQSWVRMVKVDGNLGFGYQFLGDMQFDSSPKVWVISEHRWKKFHHYRFLSINIDQSAWDFEYD